MREINSQNCIIVFLDILGYSSWIEEAKSPENIYKVFEQMLGDMQAMKEKYPMSREYFDSIEFTIWSDSLIYVIDLDNNTVKADMKKFVSWFLYYLSMFVVKFIVDTGYFLRGAITYGDFIQRKISSDEHRFIFSQAYVEAVKLEKNAETPRILLKNEFVEMARSRDLLNILVKPAVRQDIYHQYGLDYYFCLHLIPPSFKERYLGAIRDKIVSKFKDLKDEKIKKKFYYFADYHNKHVANLFPPHLLEEDFKSLGMKKEDVLLPLVSLRIVGNDADFFIKKDLVPDAGEIIRTLGYAQIPEDKKMLLAAILKQRILDSNNKALEYSIRI